MKLRHHLIPRTENRKLGNMAASFAPKQTCPDACPMKKDGSCYAAMGPINISWTKVSSGERGKVWKDFLQDVRDLPRGMVFRHAETGDLPGLNDMVDPVALDQLAEASRGKMAYTYTHKPPTKGNLAALRSAQAKGFVVSLSADSPSEADQLAKHKLPLVALVPRDTPDKFTTPGGIAGIICPFQTRGVTCAQCRLCARKDHILIGFRAHGAVRKIEKIIADRTPVRANTSVPMAA